MLSLLPWNDAGAALLEALNSPAQKRHLGGPESAEKLADRQRRYLTYHEPGIGEMLLIDWEGSIAGSIGYWETERDGAHAYEMGWEVLERWHGRGIARTAGQALIARLRPLARHRFAFAYPTPDNAGSNGLCRTLGFELQGVEDVEYPKGSWSPHNIWRLDLSPAG